MNKGTSFEQEMLKLVKRELEHGNLGISPELARVQLNPKCFSKDRGKNIIFDVSIEVFRRSAKQPYLLWIWEGKDYTSTVPVDDVEEFHAKLQQVGADRTKGTIMSSADFAEGGVNFALSNGIGLCRWIPPGSLRYFVENAFQPTGSDIVRALTTPETHRFRSFGDFYGLTSSGHFTTSMKGLVDYELTDRQFDPNSP